MKMRFNTYFRQRYLPTNEHDQPIALEDWRAWAGIPYCRYVVEYRNEDGTSVEDFHTKAEAMKACAWVWIQHRAGDSSPPRLWDRHKRMRLRTE